MARDRAQEARDAVNQGLPAHGAGLDEGTKASLRRALEGGDAGIKVGSFRDLQVGNTDIPVADRPTNPNQDDDGLIDINEHNALQVELHGADAVGDEDYSTYTVDELKDELAAQNKPVSGTKDELIARLEGK